VQPARLMAFFDEFGDAGLDNWTAAGFHGLHFAD
jgi:hypothetical protein